MPNNQDAPFLDRNKSAFSEIRSDSAPSAEHMPDHISPSFHEAEPSQKRKKSIAEKGERKKKPRSSSKEHTSQSPLVISPDSQSPPKSERRTKANQDPLRALTSHLEGEDVTRESFKHQQSQTQTTPSILPASQPSSQTQLTPPAYDAVTFLNPTPSKPTPPSGVDPTTTQITTPPSPPQQTSSPAQEPAFNKPSPSSPSPSILQEIEDEENHAWFEAEATHPHFGNTDSLHKIQQDPVALEAPFNPSWSIKNKDSVLSFNIAHQLIHQGITPTDAYHLQGLKPKDLANSAHQTLAQTHGYFSEIYRRWIQAETKTHELEDQLAMTRNLRDTINELRADLHQRDSELVKTRLALTEAAFARDKALNQAAMDASLRKDMEHTLNLTKEALTSKTAYQESMEKAHQLEITNMTSELQSCIEQLARTTDRKYLSFIDILTF